MPAKILSKEDVVYMRRALAAYDNKVPRLKKRGKARRASLGKCKGLLRKLAKWGAQLQFKKTGKAAGWGYKDLYRDLSLRTYVWLQAETDDLPLVVVDLAYLYHDLSAIPLSKSSEFRQDVYQEWPEFAPLWDSQLELHLAYKALRSLVKRRIEDFDAEEREVFCPKTGLQMPVTHATITAMRIAIAEAERDARPTRRATPIEPVETAFVEEVHAAVQALQRRDQLSLFD